MILVHLVIYRCEVTPNMWRGARLGCFLRSELYDGATTMSMIKLIRRLEQFQTQQAEEDFMDSTLQLYKDGVVQENLQRLQWDKGEGLDPEDMDIVAGTILHYFRRSQRWQKVPSSDIQIYKVWIVILYKPNHVNVF